MKKSNKDESQFYPAPEISNVTTLSLKTAKLDQKQKQILWKHMKRNHSVRATEINTLIANTNMKLLMDKLDATLVVEEKYVPECLQHLID